jgi:transcriptional/translational regulatory protein YebC/TACO1
MEMIDAGAEDIAHENGFFIVTTSMESFGNMMKKLETLKIEPESAQLQRIPKETVSIANDDAKKVLKLIEAIEADDDVQNVYHNLELTDDLIAEME